MHGTIATEQTTYWAACQILSHRSHVVRAEIEKVGHGTFVPTFVKVWYVGGKQYAYERALLPGYLFFKTEVDRWGEVSEVDGVCKVLATEGTPSRVSDEEMRRLLVDHAMGVHNKVQASPHERRRYSRRRRRPRPGKRLRAMNDR